jgi:hypothetical protein
VQKSVKTKQQGGRDSKGNFKYCKAKGSTFLRNTMLQVVLRNQRGGAPLAGSQQRQSQGGSMCSHPGVQRSGSQELRSREGVHPPFANPVRRITLSTQDDIRPTEWRGRTHPRADGSSSGGTWCHRRSSLTGGHGRDTKASERNQLAARNEPQTPATPD